MPNYKSKRGRWKRPGSNRTSAHVALTLAIAARALGAQVASAQIQPVDSLIRLSLVTHPSVRAADARIAAAQSRVVPAGLRPDPMLMVGLQNLPATRPGFGDEMTMKMVGVTQTIPRGGKLALAREVAEREVAIAVEARRGVVLGLERNARVAGYDITYVDRALAVLEKSRAAMVELIAAAEIRFGTGTAAPSAGAMGAGASSGGLADILRARVELANLAEQAVMLREQRGAAVAAIRAVTGGGADFLSARMPPRLERAAVAAEPTAIRFESAALGARVAGSPLPSADSLGAIALAQNPDLRMQSAMVAAQAIRAELVARERRPDWDVSVQYGQRDGYPDMLAATVSMPLQLHRSQRQDRYLAAERSELAVQEADRDALKRRIEAELLRLRADAERSRTQLALYKTASIPQAQLAADAATVAFRSGSGSLRAVLDAQMSVFNAEIAYHKALTDFARTIAELEALVGAEVIHD